VSPRGATRYRTPSTSTGLTGTSCLFPVLRPRTARICEPRTLRPSLVSVAMSGLTRRVVSASGLWYFAIDSSDSAVFPDQGLKLDISNLLFFRVLFNP
jgi:hypothetical protein